MIKDICLFQLFYAQTPGDSLIVDLLTNIKPEKQEMQPH
jgi:hypothetical protein